MDPTGRSSNDSLNGGQAASPNSVSPNVGAQSVSGQTAAPVAGQVTSSAAGQAPAQSSGGISSMAPSASANINAFTSRRPSANAGNSANLMSHNIPPTTLTTPVGNVGGAGAIAGGFSIASNSPVASGSTIASGSGTGGIGGAANPFTATGHPSGGDIVLNPDNAPKKSPKVPIIIGIVAIVLLAIAGVVLMIFNNSQSAETAEAANATESFNKFFNYTYTGEEKTEAITEPDVATVDYRLAEVLDSEDSATRESYFTRMNELWDEFETAYQQESGDDSTEEAAEDSENEDEDEDDSEDVAQLVEDSNEKVVYLTAFGLTRPLAADELIEYYSETASGTKAKEKIANYYTNLTNSENSTIKEMGNSLVEYSDAVISYLTEIDKQGCISYLTSKKSTLSDCPKYEQIDTTIEEEVENLQQNYDSVIATIGYQKNTLIDDCISLSEQLNNTEEQE